MIRKSSMFIDYEEMRWYFNVGLKMMNLTDRLHNKTQISWLNCVSKSSNWYHFCRTPDLAIDNLCTCVLMYHNVQCIINNKKKD